jgi:hypothetical protein
MIEAKRAQQHEQLVPFAGCGLQPAEHPPEGRAVVSVVEKRDVPARAERREELQERAWTLGKFEGEDDFERQMSKSVGADLFHGDAVGEDADVIERHVPLGRDRPASRRSPPPGPRSRGSRGELLHDRGKPGREPATADRHEDRAEGESAAA